MSPSQDPTAVSPATLTRDHDGHHGRHHHNGHRHGHRHHHHGYHAHGHHREGHHDRTDDRLEAPRPYGHPAEEASGHTAHERRPSDAAEETGTGTGGEPDASAPDRFPRGSARERVPEGHERRRESRPDRPAGLDGERFAEHGAPVEDVDFEEEPDIPVAAALQDTDVRAGAPAGGELDLAWNGATDGNQPLAGFDLSLLLLLADWGQNRAFN